MSPPPRQARATRTRERLLDATVACLVAHGYAGTTMQCVQREADVSRGALVHHFPSMDDLLVGAIHHVARRQLDELRDALAAPASHGDLRATTHVLQSFMSGPLFLAGLELWMAARTSTSLRRVLAPHERALGHEIRAALADATTTRDYRLSDDDLDELLIILRGLAVTSVLRTNSTVARHLLERWVTRLTGTRSDEGR